MLSLHGFRNLHFLYFCNAFTNITTWQFSLICLEVSSDYAEKFQIKFAQYLWLRFKIHPGYTQSTGNAVIATYLVPPISNSVTHWISFPRHNRCLYYLKSQLMQFGHVYIVLYFVTFTIHVLILWVFHERLKTQLSKTCVVHLQVSYIIPIRFIRMVYSNR